MKLTLPRFLTPASHSKELQTFEQKPAPIKLSEPTETHAGRNVMSAANPSTQAALSTPNIGPETQLGWGSSSRSIPLLPADHDDALDAVPTASKPMPLTRLTLRRWADAPGLSEDESRVRQEVMRRILARQPLFLRFSQERLSIRGDLDLRGCTALTQLPDGLSVRGNLKLGHCTALTQLPDGLSVRGNLELGGCKALSQLPDGLSICGDLCLFFCTALTHLPDGLSIGGDLKLSGCTALTQVPDGLSVRGNLELYDCTALTQLPDDLSIGGNVNLQSCTSLTQLPDGLSIGGNLDLSGCTALTQLPVNLRVKGELSTWGCANLTTVLEGAGMQPSWIALQVLQHAAQHLGPRPLGNLVFSKEIDACLMAFNDTERYEALCIMQQADPLFFLRRDFTDGLTVLRQVLPQDRAALSELLAPLVQVARARPRGGMGINLFTEICLAPAAERPRRLQELFGEINENADQRGTNVHEGNRDTAARTAARNLWDGPGMQARSLGASQIFVMAETFIEATQASDDELAAYLKRPHYDGQTHLQRAGVTLQSLRARPGVFTLDILNRREAPLAEVVAMLYNLAATVQEGSVEQTQAKRQELQRLSVAALSESLAQKDGGTYCAQGVVQRLLTPLQGYYPEVRLDAFEPPSEGDFVSDFGRDLQRTLEQAAPGTNLKALTRQEADAACERAALVYAATPDAHGDVSVEANRVASERAAKVARDIMDYLEYEGLI